MSAENSLRIFLVGFALYAALFGPPWLIFVPFVLLSMRFRAWEIMALGLVTDFLWLPGLRPPLYLIAAILIVWAFEPLRKELLLS